MRTRRLVATCLLVAIVEFIGVPSDASADDPAAVVLSAAIRAGAARPVPESWIRDEASRLARGLSAEQRQKLADDPGSASALVAPRNRSRVVATDLRSLAPTPELIGDPESDLLFVPVAPCRVIDTRFATAGILAGNTARGFVVAGTLGFSAQGGEAAGCGIPLGGASPLASAVALNFIAVAPLGPGNLRAWEFGQPAPNASVINYDVPTIANGVIVPIAGVVSQPSDLSVRADVSGTHVVADVTGYFTRVEVERVKSTVDSGFEGSSQSIGDGACHEITTCTVDRPVPGTAVVMVAGSAAVSHTVGVADGMTIRIDSASPVSCTGSLDDQSALFEVPAAEPTRDYRVPFSWNTSFNLSAGAAITYRLGMRMSAGANSLDVMTPVRMTCLFVPD